MSEPHAMTAAHAAASRPARRGALRTIAAIALGLVLGALFSVYVATAAVVDGRSMEPGLHGGDLVVLLRPGIDRLIGHGTDATSGRRPWSPSYAPGDVVALSDPTGPGLMLKRIVAVGPATVAMADGTLSVDGRDSAIGAADGYGGHADLAPVAVPAGELFVLGDNRRPLASRDSRHYGPVAGSSVRGRLVARLPLSGLLGAVP